MIYFINLLLVKNIVCQYDLDFLYDELQLDDPIS